MGKYLYGASVQGIQGFIFETNKLQEIVGASEIVKKIEEHFLTFSNYEKENDNILLNAAGNVKALFNKKEDCETLVKSFSKYIQKEAYGITLSQALIVIESDYPSDKEFKALDDALKVQRNKPSIPLDMSLNIMELNPATAKPITHREKKGKDELLFNKALEQKREAFPIDSKFKELKDLSNGKNKIAVIHADGNGLGKLVPILKKRLSKFSVQLDEATREAFKKAKEDSKTENMKIRDVICGGDDLTVICDANEALGFIERYLQNFEDNTKNIDAIKELYKEKKITFDKLTACAGIAYTNEKYPFHYAVSLAESLCGQAKNHSNREASCVMFHNIQSSNYQTWSKFVEDELTISNDKHFYEEDRDNQEVKTKPIRCDFAPYYLDKNTKPSIFALQNSVEAYRCDGSPISRLRNWLSELGKSDTYSTNLLTRINTMLEQSNEWNCKIMDNNLDELYSGLTNSHLCVEKDNEYKTPIYDILQILSVTEASNGN